MCDEEMEMTEIGKKKGLESRLVSISVIEIGNFILKPLEA